MKIAIHIGMPKTGSSSIQRTFGCIQHPDLEYINWDGRPDPVLFGLLFEQEDKVAQLPAFRARGKQFIETLPVLREKAVEDLVHRLSSAKGKTVVFSSELIAMPQFHAATHRMYEFFAQWSDDIQVVGYVRPPGGYAASSFQQMLKGGTVPSNMTNAIALHCRARFEGIDNIFGRERVKLKEFSAARLLDGDVVQDFAQEIGIGPLKPDQIVRANEGLNLEAVALLYVQRKMGQGFVDGFPDVFAANTQFISKLAVIGRRKFAFSRQMLAPVLENQAEDIGWMEERLGHRFSDMAATYPDAITSLDDLVSIALKEYEAVQEILGDAAAPDGPETLDSLVRSLETLRKHAYAQVSGAKRAINRPTNKESSLAKESKMKETDLEIRLRHGLALALWHADNQGRLPQDADEKGELYRSEQSEYLRRAALITTHLNRQKISLQLESENV